MSQPCNFCQEGRTSTLNLQARKSECRGCAVLFEILLPFCASDLGHYLELTKFHCSRTSSFTIHDSPYVILIRQTHGLGLLALNGHAVTIALTAIPEISNPWSLSRVDCGDLIGGFDEQLAYNITGQAPIVNLGDDTGSCSTLKLALKWMEDCTQYHQSTCGSSDKDDPLLPSRVLHIGNSTSNRIVLCEPKGERGRYMCLSYCWGQSKFIQSTRDSIESFKTGFQVQDLPKTFQHFVSVAQAFGVQYVWVDALCILQDCENDWKKEAARMAEIYQHSYLTVAATQAHNPEDGCFSKRSRIRADSVHATFTRHFPNTISSEDPNTFPLLGRAWAFQERILSPRVLHFTADEIMWECVECRKCECGRNAYSRDEVSKTEYFKRCILHPPTEEMKYEPSVENLWRNIVVQYSGLNLTKPSDKLPALSGLAEPMRISRGEEYLAGLWRGSLLSDLLWYREVDHDIQFGHVNDESWRAPSWSWASVDGPVMYRQPLYCREKHEKDGEHCTIIDAQCTPAGISKTGEVESGFIKLRCQLLWGTRDCQLIQLDPGFIWCYFDREDDGISEVCLARIAEIEHEEFALALQVVDSEKQTFKRIGLAYVHQSDQVLKTQESRVITII